MGQQAPTFRISVRYRIPPRTLLWFLTSILISGLVWPQALLSRSAPVRDGRTEPPAARAYPEGTRPLEGVIIRVVSGGELGLWEKGKVHAFRLYGISLPPLESPGGRQAKKKVSDLTFNTLLQVHLMPSPPAGKQGNPSLSGVVIIRGRCLNEILVRSGMARVADTCTAEEICRQWKAAEEAARNQKAGIWGP